jgi:hypothetical protein
MTLILAWLGVFIAWLLSASGASIGGAPNASAGSGAICGPRKAASILARGGIRVYALPAHAGEHSERLFGCLGGATRSYRLNATPRRPVFGEDRSVSVGTKTITVNAPRIAYTEVFYGRDTSVLAIAVRDLSRGTVAYCKAAFTEAPASVPVIKKIALSSTWSVGWIGRSRPPHESGRSPLSPRVIESGEGIDLNSLGLHGVRLTWLNAGTQHSIQLTPKGGPKQ